MPAHPENAGRQRHLTLPVTVVYCHGVGEEEGWVALVLHRLPQLERPNQEGCLSPAPNAGDHGEHGGHLTLFLHRLEEWVLAGQDGQRVQAVYCLYGR